MMMEVDGPPCAYFEGQGQRYVYEARGLISKDQVGLLYAYTAWRKSVEDSDRILVWRQRPHFDYDSSTEEWSVFFRYVTIPFRSDVAPVPVKIEGEPAARL